MATYLDELSQAVGFRAYSGARPFRGDLASGEGAVIGARNGYLVCIGPANLGSEPGIFIGVRARALNQPDQVLSAVKALPACKGRLNAKRASLQENAALVFWPYALKKPAATDVAALAAEIMACVSSWALPFDGKCEDCGSAVVSEITLKNGTPGYHCAGCQQRLAAEGQQKAAEYSGSSGRHLSGVVAGVVAAFLAAVSWGLLVSWIDSDPGTWHPKLHAVGAAYIGLASSLAVFKTSGKVTRFGQVLVVLLAFCGKLLADSIFYAISISKSGGGLTWSLDLQLSVITQIWTLKFSGISEKIVFGGDILLSLALPLLPWAKTPSFAVTFEPLATEASMPELVNAASQA